MYQTVREEPGMNISEIAQRTGLSHPTAAYHLRQLGRAGLVHDVPFSRWEKRWVATVDEASVRECKVKIVAGTRNMARVLDRLDAVEPQGTYIRDLACSLEIPRTTVDFHLDRLESLELARLDKRAGKYAFYRITPEGRPVAEAVRQRYPDVLRPLQTTESLPAVS